MLVLGAAYKPDVDDCRESPAVELMELLQDRGAEVAYNDPHVPALPPLRRHAIRLESTPLTAEVLAAQDCVLIATDHAAYDCEFILRARGPARRHPGRHPTAPRPRFGRDRQGVTARSRSGGRSPGPRRGDDGTIQRGDRTLPPAGTMTGPKPAASRLTAGRLLARNAAWSVAGRLAPMLVALFALPMLIEGLGTDRFGFLTLAWLVIGYFNLLDLGLGRALTLTVADRLGTGREPEVPGLVRATVTAMVLLGAAGAVLLAAFSPWLVRSVIRVPAELRGEAARALVLLAVSVPLVIGSAGLRGVLEAYQKFGPLNLVGALLSSFSYLGPLLVLPFSGSLVATVGVLLAGRTVLFLAYLALCRRVLPPLPSGTAVRAGLIGPLLRSGGWMTVSNVVSPLMVTLDRFVIGATVSMAAVAHYATPYEVVTKLWIVPTALVGVLFPAFAMAMAGGGERAAALFDRGVRVVYLALLPAVLILVLLGREGLGLWLGDEFARSANGAAAMAGRRGPAEQPGDAPLRGDPGGGPARPDGAVPPVRAGGVRPPALVPDRPLRDRGGRHRLGVADGDRRRLPDGVLRALPRGRRPDGRRRLAFVLGAALPAALIPLRVAPTEVRAVVLLVAMLGHAALAWRWGVHRLAFAMLRRRGAES